MKAPTGIREAVEKANAAMNGGADEWHRHLLGFKLPAGAKALRTNIRALKRLHEERTALYESKYGATVEGKILDKELAEKVIEGSVDVPDYRIDADKLWEELRRLSRKEALNLMARLGIEYNP